MNTFDTWTRPKPRGRKGGRKPKQAKPSAIDLTKPISSGKPKAPAKSGRTGPYSRNSRVQLFRWSSELELLLRVKEQQAPSRQRKEPNPDTGSSGQSQRRTLAVPDAFGQAPDAGVIPRAAWDALWNGTRPRKPPSPLHSYRLVRGCCNPDTMVVYLPETLPHVDYIRSRLSDHGIGTLLF